VSIPSFPPMKEPRHEIHCVRLVTSERGPWLVFANALMTDWRMWSFVIPMLLDKGFNMLLHSQRGHGLSTLPAEREGEERLTTIPLLATDIYFLLDELGIPTPVESVIGVSQGGAAALGFAGLYGEKTRSVVVCDTAAATPGGNKEAWEERIWYGAKEGMGGLGKMTVARWFPNGRVSDGRAEWVEGMIGATGVAGFVHGARALGSYDVHEMQSVLGDGKKRLFDTGVERVLLVAGREDGGGRVAEGMRRLQAEWGGVEYAEVEESGHLPMVDSPDVFCDVVLRFLGQRSLL
jgi:pimeloyl-ACP methyl ester carboxylesterase